MGKRLKELCEWIDNVGYSSHAWIGGDWHIPLHFLSKLLATELEQRRKTTDLECDSDVTLKISFDSLLQFAEDTLGVPVLITERDLLTRYPNIHLALVTYLVCLKTTIDHFDAKQIRNTAAPKLVFEAKNGFDASLPTCPMCNEHVFIIERVVIERVVYHRQCLKCTECSRLLSRGGYKRTKQGFECISHAVRKILDAHESSYSSGSSSTYDRYGGKSPRPGVAPPPRPKPKPPPKPSYLSSRPDPVYETLDGFTEDTTAKSPLKQAPLVEPETFIQVDGNNPFDEDDEPDPTKPSSINGADTETMKDRKEIDEEDSPSISTNDYTSSGDSCDSGVVLRMARLFSGEQETPRGRTETRTRISQPQLPNVPVAPPRVKRASMLVASASPAPIRPSRSPAPPPAPKPRMNLEDYPGYLCPFGEVKEDEDESESSCEYPEGKNPFADSDDEYTMRSPVPAPRSLPPPLPVLPGTSDRPKVQPPPPPPGAQIDPSTPPPKPPRTLLNSSADARIHTLRISRKKHRAPLPPVTLVQKRQINFTEAGLKVDPSVICSRLKEIEDQMVKIEIEGRSVEKEMLFQIETNPRTWWKISRADDWVNVLTRKLDLTREQLHLLGQWRENYLNEVHSETEYYIRCLLEKEKMDKSEWEIEREAALTNLLIYIIDEKLKLDEYMADLTEGNDDHNSPSAKAAQKKKTLKKRMSMLTKKLKTKKSHH